MAVAETLRAFVAIELTEEARQHLALLTDGLRHEVTHGIRWVDHHGVHLTLKFLGDLPVDRLDAVIAAMEEAADGVPPFSLSIHSLGAFPGLSAPRVLWAGVQGDLAPLLMVQTRLEESLAARGFPREGRPFSPHLTLARVRGKLSPADMHHLAATVESARAQPKRELHVHLLSLMESTLTAHGALYARRGQISLQPTLAQ
ncbi:MAG: RNA 2',3'-cyclic phosphodiesterase [Chloroflexi bacterium]|nr:RNA 2',3'-cyclic phosphodiesterase [Chloroflexota bacterium]MCZ6892087.1 RNA 2',3'-cyclic phosphodiesterase [Chloroflexota bacterium]